MARLFCVVMDVSAIRACVAVFARTTGGNYHKQIDTGTSSWCGLSVVFALALFMRALLHSFS